LNKEREYAAGVARRRDTSNGKKVKTEDTHKNKRDVYRKEGTIVRKVLDVRLIATSKKRDRGCVGRRSGWPLCESTRSFDDLATLAPVSLPPSLSDVLVVCCHGREVQRFEAFDRCDGVVSVPDQVYTIGHPTTLTRVQYRLVQSERLERTDERLGRRQ
jgi:hypothetical protein